MAFWGNCRLTLKLKIFCCDTYGRPFLEKLTNRLKNEGYISNYHISITKFVGPCNQKLDRQMNALYFQKSFNAFLIVADADGNPPEPIRDTICCHFSESINWQVEVIIFKYEIEDWICISKGICIKGNKSAEALMEHEPYQKFRLPDYADILDIEKLLNECESFKKFIAFLKKLKNDRMRSI
jgi:uncharacterized Fe-S cluster protein YjdI